MKRSLPTSALPSGALLQALSSSPPKQHFFPGSLDDRALQGRGLEGDRFWAMLDCRGESPVPRIRDLGPYLILYVQETLVPSPVEWDCWRSLCIQAGLRCSAWDDS